MADLVGIGVSPGIAAGPLLRMGEPPRLPAASAPGDPEQEVETAGRALSEVTDDLDGRSQRAADPLARAILEAQSLIAADPTLYDGVLDRVRSGLDAGHAVAAAFAEHRQALQAAGGYLAERVTDLDDVRDRVLAAVLGQPMPGLPEPGYPYVLAAPDLSPVDTAGLDPDQVLAVVTERGSPTSHTAILARSLGLPAVVGCTGAMSVPDGTLVQVDGNVGAVLLGISPDAVAAARAAHAQGGVLTGTSGTSGSGSSAPGSGPGPATGATADGHPVGLLANIGSAADLRRVVPGTGIGLFRTEFLFLGRQDAPALDEQVAAYRAVLQAMPGRKVVIRTLDAGADKPLPFLGLADEPNPALGVRGIRVARAQPGVLDTQLGAIATAAQGTGAEVWVMAPMVATRREAADFVERARVHGLPTAGVMVEIPAAALRADRLLGPAGFLSIGTNDLSQYTLAADRQCSDLADLLDPWQPALLQLVAACAAAGLRAGKPVGVCGEAAADPLLATVLVGLGVTSLSMSARAIPAVAAQLAAHTLADCERFASLALDADEASESRAAVAKATGTG